MSTLKSLIAQVTWASVAKVLQQQKNPLPHALPTYHAVFQILKKISALPVHDCEIVITTSRDGIKQAQGKMAVPDEAGDPIWRYFDLALAPWEEWLGMPVSTETLQQFSPEEIVAHCLIEMTRFGADESKIDEIYHAFLLSRLAPIVI